MLAQKSILVVDDDENLVRALSIRLRAMGYEVFAAMDGMQAVMMTHRKEPDLIILDIRMPGGSGLSVMDKLRGSIKTRHIPVIVETAFDDEETKQKVKELGAFKYFRKPFETDDLLKAIEEALSADAEK
jgi:CheY-like chemotaxis protein